MRYLIMILISTFITFGMLHALECNHTITVNPVEVLVMDQSSSDLVTDTTYTLYPNDKRRIHMIINIP